MNTATGVEEAHTVSEYLYTLDKTGSLRVSLWVLVLVTGDQSKNLINIAQSAGTGVLIAQR